MKQCVTFLLHLGLNRVLGQAHFEHLEVLGVHGVVLDLNLLVLAARGVHCVTRV